MNRFFNFGLAAFTGVAMSSPALAHATFANPPAKVGAYVAASLQVPHGCDGKATNEVQVRLPEGFISAKPMVKAGWNIEIIEGAYKKTYDNHGTKITSGPVEIRWKNGELPDNFYDTFVIYGKVADGGPDGLAFPTVQLCGKDGKVAWDEIAAAGVDPHSLKSPAPVLKIAAPEPDAVPMGHMHGQMQGNMQGQGTMMAQANMHAGHGAMDGSAMAAANPGTFETTTLGDLELSAGFSKATLPGQPVGGGFITIRNGGEAEDVLIGAESPSAGHVELHEMAMVGDVMKMRQLNDGIVIPAGQSVELKPGGLHMMFMDLKEPFVGGGVVKVKLTFKNAGSVDVTLPVVAMPKKN